MKIKRLSVKDSDAIDEGRPGEATIKATETQLLDLLAQYRDEDRSQTLDFQRV